MIQRFLLQQKLPQVFGPFGLVPACRCQGSAGILWRWSSCLLSQLVLSCLVFLFLPSLHILELPCFRTFMSEHSCSAFKPAEHCSHTHHWVSETIVYECPSWVVS